MTSNIQHVVIVGAGIIGLSTATLLQQMLPRTTQIHIVAAETPTTSPMLKAALNGPADVDEASADYASMWAGAHYRPIPFLPMSSSPYNAASPAQQKFHRQLTYEAGLALRTATHMKTLAREQSESSVQIVPAAEYLESPPAENLLLRTGDIYASDDDHFRVLSQAELETVNENATTGKVAWACQYDTYVVNVHTHCAWLLDHFCTNGGSLEKRKCTTLEDAFVMYDETCPIPLVINCSGRNFDLDPKMKILRGQTVLVTNPYHSTVTRQNSDGSWSFLIPRPNNGGTIIGGTKEVGDLEDRARPETRRKLLENAVAYFPDFVSNMDDFEVVCDNVGRRPWREGGVRIESEDYRLGESHPYYAGMTGKVVHGYGAGGRGFELSYGVAEEIFKLVETCLGTTTQS